MTITPDPFNIDDEFYYDTPKFPNDFEGNPAYAPVDYAHPTEADDQLA